MYYTICALGIAHIICGLRKLQDLDCNDVKRTAGEIFDAGIEIAAGVFYIIYGLGSSGINPFAG